VFERFTDAARGVVVLAQEEARGLGHESIAPEHLLLGVVRTEQPLLRVSEGEVRAIVVEQLGTGLGNESAIPFTDGAKSVLESALESALALSDRHIAPVHLLRALLDPAGPAAILRRCGRPPEEIRSELEGLPPAAPARPDPRDPRWAVEVRLAHELLGDLGNPRVDARLLLAIVLRNREVAAWLAERGVDEATVRERWLP